MHPRDYHAVRGVRLTEAKGATEGAPSSTDRGTMQSLYRWDAVIIAINSVNSVFTYYHG